MRLISVAVYFAFFIFMNASVEARTRAPKTENEHSLLYWRYLCENQPQLETSKSINHSGKPSIELSCQTQNWKVRADGDLVREVVEDAKK